MLSETVIPYADLAGIPLTPELLERNGFKWAREGSKVQILTIAHEDTDMPCTLQYQVGTTHMCIARCGMYAIAPTIKYLHELQLLTTAIGAEMNVEI